MDVVGSLKLPPGGSVSADIGECHAIFRRPFRAVLDRVYCGPVSDFVKGDSKALTLSFICEMKWEMRNEFHGLSSSDRCYSYL